MIDSGKRFLAYYLDPLQNDEESNSETWTPIAPDLNLLEKWLQGDASEEDLRDWLKKLYPEDMHDSIMEGIKNDLPLAEEKSLDKRMERFI